MQKYFLILASILILTASPVFAETGSTTLAINSPSTTASFTFNFGDKTGAKNYPTISTFESSDATLDFDKNIFTASANDIPGEDLVALIGDFDPKTQEIKGTFTGFQNYESKNGKIYTRTAFDGTFTGRVSGSSKISPITGPIENQFTGSSTAIFSSVFCSKLDAKGSQVCPAENTTYKGSFVVDGSINVVAPRPVVVPVQVVVATTTPVVLDSSATPLIKYGAFLFIIALILYFLYFLVSGGFF